MMKQYGIDPRPVIWIQRNAGHDMQTFSDLAKMKSLDSRRRNFAAVKKIEDIRLPSSCTGRVPEQGGTHGGDPQGTGPVDQAGRFRQMGLVKGRRLPGDPD